MRVVKVLCLEGEPVGRFHMWGSRDGDTVGIVELEKDGQVICVHPESIQFIDVRRVAD